VYNALRNLTDPRNRIILIPSEYAIVMQAPADQIAAAEKLLNDLDRRQASYRLTYTLIDLDGTKRLGDQHYTMVLVPGQRAVLKQGNKVPVVTGAYLKELNSPQTQITYLDVGMNFEATLDYAPSLRLKTKVEQSSVLEDRSSTAAQDPVVRQSVFEGSAILTPGKPLTIGTLDIAGTTRRVEIQATVDPINP
jgi:type II secretory pathway component GspD/PulD (secretin)